MGELEPVWAKYAARKRVYTEGQRQDHEAAKSHYHAVVEESIVEGLGWRAAGEHLGLSAAVMGRIVRRWKNQQKAMKCRAAAMKRSDWADAITEKFKERLMAVAESKEGITVEQYNQMKVGQTHFKGTGIYRVGDGGLPALPANNTTIYQNVAILMNMSPEEQEKLLEESRRGLLDIPVEGHGPIRRLGKGNEAAEERSAVVVEKQD